MKSFGSTYDRDTSTLYMYMDEVRYRWKGPSPYHNDQFRKRAKRNWNSGVKYIEKIFGKGERA